jgi:hypothetical protein
MNTILILIAVAIGCMAVGLALAWGFVWALERRMRRSIPPIVGHREEDWR